MPLLTVIPYFSGDKDQAVRLANWIKTLGGVKSHDALLVVDKSTTPDGVIEPLQEAFRSVSFIMATPAGPQGAWGTGTTDASAANEMWLTAIVYILHKKLGPFFWLEPDAVPLRPTWLDEIEAEYRKGQKPFMGMLVNIPPHEAHMSGVGCYPQNVADHSLAMATPGPTAWDYAGRNDTVGRKRAHFTDLIQHEYRVHGESPNFPTTESLSIIKPRAAVFHRCKDSSAIDRLRERLNRPEIRANTPEKVAEQLNQGDTLRREARALMQVIAERDARIAELEQSLSAAQGMLKTDTSAKKKHRIPMKRSTKKRTADEQAKINARMEKVRAGRKKLTGVV